MFLIFFCPSRCILNLIIPFDVFSRFQYDARSFCFNFCTQLCTRFFPMIVICCKLCSAYNAFGLCVRVDYFYLLFICFFGNMRITYSFFCIIYCSMLLLFIASWNASFFGWSYLIYDHVVVANLRFLLLAFILFILSMVLQMR